MRIVTLSVLVAGLLGASCASARREDPPRPAREIVSGGARLRGGGVRMDVQIGRPFRQSPAPAGRVVVKPAAVVTP